MGATARGIKRRVAACRYTGAGVNQRLRGLVECCHSHGRIESQFATRGTRRCLGVTVNGGGGCEVDVARPRQARTRTDTHHRSRINEVERHRDTHPHIATRGTTGGGWQSLRHSLHTVLGCERNVATADLQRGTVAHQCPARSVGDIEGQRGRDANLATARTRLGFCLEFVLGIAGHIGHGRADRDAAGLDTGLVTNTCHRSGRHLVDRGRRADSHLRRFSDCRPVRLGAGIGVAAGGEFECLRRRHGAARGNRCAGVGIDDVDGHCGRHRHLAFARRGRGLAAGRIARGRLLLRATHLGLRLLGLAVGELAVDLVVNRRVLGLLAVSTRLTRLVVRLAALGACSGRRRVLG